MEAVKKHEPRFGNVRVTALPKLAPGPGRTTGPARRSTKGGWTEQEDDMLTRAVKLYNGRNWKKIAESFPGRSDVQCLHRWQKVLNPDLVKGPWSKEEDDRIIELVEQHGSKKWSVIAQSLPGRIGKQCRERWHNHLNPAIKKHAWTQEEELALIRAHQMFGNKWAEIAKFLPGRADNSIKNHWNCSVKKKLDSYLASGLAGDLLGICAHNAYNHDFKEESTEVRVSNCDPEIVSSLEKDSGDSIDTSLGMSVVRSTNGSENDLESHSELSNAENRCLKEELHCQKEDANDGRISDDLHHSVTEAGFLCGVSFGKSVMSTHSVDSMREPANFSNNSPRPSGEISLSLPTLIDPFDVTYGRRNGQSPHMVGPVSAKKFLASPKRPRHNALPLPDSGDTNLKLNTESNTLFSNLSGGIANEPGDVHCKSVVVTSPLHSKDAFLSPSFYEPSEQVNTDISLKIGRFSSTKKNLQPAFSPDRCCTPPSRVGSIYTNGNSPETILRTAARNFKNTPSIIRKRTREVSKQNCNVDDSNDVSISQARSGSSNDSQGSMHSCDPGLFVRSGLTDTNHLNIKWLSLSSPSFDSETDASLKSVEKRLEYAFDLEWDDSKAKCSDSATESDSIGSNFGTVHSAPDSSQVRSNKNSMLHGFGVNCNSYLND